MRPIAVRELCAFTAKRGDLDLRFTPSPTAEQGIEGHAKVVARRGESYQREVPLQGQYKSLLLRGRADGLSSSPLRLEEIKTYRGDLARLPENHQALHWAQLKTYGALLAAERDLESLDLRLVYFNIHTEKETALDLSLTRAELDAFLAEHGERYASWHAQEAAHREARNAALAAVAFPHAQFHGGQRQLAEAVYRHIANGQSLLAQAPTGIGKSIGTLFPALKAMAQGKVEKVLFLTAKTSGRQTALDALASLQAQQAQSEAGSAPSPLPLRVLEMVAREKACEHPDKACHGESCPLACGFYDRLPAARQSAVTHRQLDHGQLKAIAASHTVCPYYLSQELARWADVIVGDYNYYFDQSALLHGLTVVNEWPVAVLVDEAHNLVERGRGMYSATLGLAALAAVRKLSPPPIHRAIGKVLSAWRALDGAQVEDFQIPPEPPAELLELLRRLATKVGEYFTEQPSLPAPELQRVYFDLLNLLGVAEDFGPHALCVMERVSASQHRGQSPRKAPAKDRSTLSIRNVVPGRYLKGRIETATAVIAFSATLQPAHFYRELLGFGEATRWLDVPSPFSADQLELQIVKGLSTRYRDRERSVAPIASLIAERFRRTPGNYLAFFSSYAYLDQVVTALRSHEPTIPLRVQGRGMTERDRAAFLDGFTQDSAAVGFAVLGGAFSEGVDLPGKRLIGVFVATLGLPPFDALCEEMRRRMAVLFGTEQAEDFTYLYPGMQKVVQAAGRVIRSVEDRGAVVLIDDRFGQGRVRALLPGWWG